MQGAYTDSSMKQKFGLADYNDSAFAIAFLAHVAGVAVWVAGAAATGGFSVPSQHRVSALLQVVRGGHHHEIIDDQASHEFLMLLVLAGVLFALVWAGIWLVLLRAIPDKVVTASIISLPVICGVTTVLLFASGAVVMGCISAIGAVLAGIWVYMVWDRIDYTSHVVKATSTTYARSSGIFGVALCSVFAQAAWSLFWLAAVLPLCSGRFSGPLGAVMWPLLLLSYFWTCQVVGNILYMSCAGVIARWYYGLQGDDAVAKSTKQACTFSFGSICYGSLLIAVIQTLKALCQMAQEQAEQDENPAVQCCFCIVQAILGCIEDLVQIFNSFAFAYIAIYGMGFWDAGNQVHSLVEETGAEPMMHYSLINVVSLFGTLTGGFFTSGLTGTLAFMIGLSGGYVFGVACLGFLTGLAVMSVISRMMEAGSIALFLCFVEEPNTLRQSDWELAGKLDEKIPIEKKGIRNAS